jgi:hypothetical protein
MSFDLFMDDTCPRCRKPIKLAVIEQHSTRRDLAVHKFECADCGVVKTTSSSGSKQLPHELAA